MSVAPLIKLASITFTLITIQVSSYCQQRINLEGAFGLWPDSKPYHNLSHYTKVQHTKHPMVWNSRLAISYQFLTKRRFSLGTSIVFNHFYEKRAWSEEFYLSNGDLLYSEKKRNEHYMNIIPTIDLTLILGKFSLGMCNGITIWDYSREKTLIDYPTFNSNDYQPYTSIYENTVFWLGAVRTTLFTKYKLSNSFSALLSTSITSAWNNGGNLYHYHPAVNLGIQYRLWEQKEKPLSEQSSKYEKVRIIELDGRFGALRNNDRVWLINTLGMSYTALKIRNFYFGTSLLYRCIIQSKINSLSATINFKYFIQKLNLHASAELNLLKPIHNFGQSTHKHIGPISFFGYYGASGGVGYNISPKFQINLNYNHLFETAIDQTENQWFKKLTYGFVDLSVKYKVFNKDVKTKSTK